MLITDEADLQSHSLNGAHVGGDYVTTMVNNERNVSQKSIMVNSSTRTVKKQKSSIKSMQYYIYNTKHA